MKNRSAIITGASKGIGKAIARRLLADGFDCILVDIEAVQEQAYVSDTGGKAIFYSCDISREESVKNLFRELGKRFDQIDVLVNNAGIIKDNMIWKMSAEDFDAVINVNLKGTWLMCREIATLMKKQNKGRIVNIASRAWLGNPGQSNYAPSKAGIVSLTRVLALELGRYGILVNAVAPGLIDTPLTKDLSDEIRLKLIEAQPTKNMGQPEDVAQLVSFLCHEDTRFITGQTIYVDGGKSIGAGL